MTGFIGRYAVGKPGKPQYPGRILASAVLAIAILLTLNPLAALAAPNPGAFTTLDGAGADRDLGTGPSKDYMTVSLNLTQQSFVRVSFSGYAYAKSSAGGTITPGCPCLVRGELRADGEPKQIVTRTALSTDADDVVADPAATPAVAAADRRDFSGSHVFSLPAGNHTFVMSLTREVGTAQNVGFAFGRMQAVAVAGATQDNFAVLDGAGADRDLGANAARDYMTTKLTTTQQSFVRVSFTGYAYAKSSAGNTQTTGCPCLVRGELRADQEAKQIVTRTVLSTDANDVVADPAATPAVAAADRRDFSGSTVYSLPAGEHTFVMSLAREVGTAQNVGFAFGRMQAEVLPDLTQAMVATLDGAGADRDLGAGPSKDYMTVTVTVPSAAVVRVGFTGYAFAKSSAGNTQTTGCPCLVRGELRANQEAKQIVTRSVVGTDPNDIVADPAATPAVAAADRRDFSGSHVFSVPAGTHTFVMSLTREVGTAQNVGFAFGRMQAEVLNAPAASPSPAPSATPAPSAVPTATPVPPTPTPVAPQPMPGLPNTGGGASATGTSTLALALGGLVLLSAAVVAAVALRRRTI